MVCGVKLGAKGCRTSMWLEKAVGVELGEGQVGM